MAILVYLHLVDQTHNVGSSELKVHAHVYQTIWDGRQIVALNAPSMQNVLAIKHARMNVVKILALALVDRMPFVALLNTILYALVIKVTREILWSNVHPLSLNVRYLVKPSVDIFWQFLNIFAVFFIIIC